MLSPLVGLWVALSGFTVYYLGMWWSGARAVVAGRDVPPEAAEKGFPSVIHLAIGFVTNFFDTLGIGSFAPTTAIYKFFRLVPDEQIPGTLNVGHALPTVVQALVFIAVVKVDPTTLITMIAA